MSVDYGPFLNSIGGKEAIEKIVKVFYDKVYEHHWLKQYFQHIPQERIEAQQVDFVVAALGGPQDYCGQLPVKAHSNMFINDELFELRENVLKKTFKELGTPQELVDKWLKIDYSFKNKIVKTSRDQCEKHFFTDVILDFDNPDKKSA